MAKLTERSQIIDTGLVLQAGGHKRIGKLMTQTPTLARKGTDFGLLYTAYKDYLRLCNVLDENDRALREMTVDEVALVAAMFYLAGTEAGKETNDEIKRGQ